MKFGCCVNMVAKGKDGTGVESVEKLSRYGYDYVEMPAAEMMALSDEEFLRVHERIEKSGIRCETCNNFFPKSISLTGPNINEDEIMAYVEKAIKRISSLGAQVVVFGSGRAKNVPAGFPMDEGYHQVVALLKSISPIAQRNNISIVIEPLRRAECNLINTFAQGCKLADDVNRENVKVLVDFYHLSQENEPVEHLVNLGEGHLKHVHFACVNGRKFPQDIKEDNYRPFIESLKKIGYGSRVSVEAYADDFDKQAPLALKLLKENF